MGEDFDFDDDQQMRRRLAVSPPSAWAAAPFEQNRSFCIYQRTQSWLPTELVFADRRYQAASGLPRAG
jgi:hypothetical protein